MHLLDFAASSTSSTHKKSDVTNEHFPFSHESKKCFFFVIHKCGMREKLTTVVQMLLPPGAVTAG
jgi:hypothetical protein